MPTTPPRRRSLADLDARIGLAEQDQERCRLEVQDQAAAARSTARPAAILRLANERLSLLRRSRQVLLGKGAAGSADDGG
jgi:hypothetical protein